jgi:hypothetical protein
MEWAWNFLLSVSGVILCNVHAGEFGVSISVVRVKIKLFIYFYMVQ